MFLFCYYRYSYFSYEIPQQNALAQQYFGANLPDLWEIENNADLLLINSYQELVNIRPSVPTTIHLGGIHTNPQEILPTHLSDFIESSVNGVVFVNLGISNSQYCITQRRLETLLYAINKLKLDIVWNCDNDLMVNSTVKIYHAHDMYQEDILGE